MFKFPRIAQSNIWMGWTFGSVNADKATVIERLPSLQTPFGRWATINQTHSDIVQVVDEPGTVGEGDGTITSQVGLGLVIQTADCVPVFLIGEQDGMTQVAAVHAGWRGIANQIVVRAIEQMDTIHTAVIGPCIGVNRYEVGEEVIQAMVDAGIPREVCTQERVPRPHLDVKMAVAHQLRQAHIRTIETSGACTYSNTGWASYRRDGQNAGRILSVIGIVS